MISLYVGPMRSGKTLHYAKEMVRYLRLGRRVISNTPVWYVLPNGRKVSADFYDRDGERFTYEVMRARGAAIGIDEASLVFSSLRWNKLQLDWFAKFRQGAKQSCDLLLTTQSFSDTIASIRRVADRSFYCSKHFWLIPFPLDFRREVWDKKKGLYRIKGMYLHTPMVYRMMRVDPRYFRTTARWELRRQYIHYSETMYPSEAKRIMRCYDHEYEIGFSAVGKLSYFKQEAEKIVAEESENDTEKGYSQNADNDLSSKDIPPLEGGGREQSERTEGG